MLRAAVIVASTLTIVSAQAAEYRRFCTPQNQCFVCVRGQPSCEVTYALSRAMTPPSPPTMARVVPPAPVPSPAPSHSQAPPPPAGAAPPPSQQEWKQAIIDEAQRYCDSFPADPICHFKDQPAQ
jgi:hypothetical protein